MVTLINFFFPTWFLPIIPSWLWLIMPAVNFLIDSLVLLGWAKTAHLRNPGLFWKRSILRVWIFGFLCDLLASLILVLLYFGMLSINETSQAVVSLGGSSVYGLLGAVLGALLIFLLDSRWAFNKTSLQPANKRSAAFWLAVITAPWLMAIPMEWILRFAGGF